MTTAAGSLPSGEDQDDDDTAGAFDTLTGLEMVDGELVPRVRGRR